MYGVLTILKMKSITEKEITHELYKELVKKNKKIIQLEKNLKDIQKEVEEIKERLRQIWPAKR